MTVCLHNEIRAVCNILHLTEVEGGPIVARRIEVRVFCFECATPFRFEAENLRSGLDLTNATISPDSMEVQIPILPALTDVPIWAAAEIDELTIEAHDAGPSGFETSRDGGNSGLGAEPGPDA